LNKEQIEKLFKDHSTNEELSLTKAEFSSMLTKIRRSTTIGSKQKDKPLIGDCK
jgi:hypothetical protein